MKAWNGREIVPTLLCFLALFIGWRSSPYFLDFHYLLLHSSLYIEAGVMALGMTLVIVCGQIDLSVASMLSLSACVLGLAVRSGMSPMAGVILAVCCGGVLGLVNGLLVGFLRIPSFLITLGTMACYRGLAQTLVHSQSIRLPFTDGAEKLFLLPFALLTAVVGLILHKTVLGRWIYSIGTSETAALFSGIPTRSVVLTVFALNGLLAGTAGVIMDQRLGVARFDHGMGLELDAITAVVLGGASISGGEGTVAGTVLALVLLGLVKTQMGIANITSEFQLAVLGTLLVVSVLLGNLVDRLSRSFGSRLPWHALRKRANRIE